VHILCQRVRTDMGHSNAQTAENDSTQTECRSQWGADGGPETRDLATNPSYVCIAITCVCCAFVFALLLS
jgi:hypothetical protein